MKIFKELKKLDYKHYAECTIEELDDLPLNSEERIMEQALVLKWFREKYNIEGQVKSWKEKGGIIWHYSIQKIGEPSIFRSIDCTVPTYEEAQLISLIKLIEIVKK